MRFESLPQLEAGFRQEASSLLTPFSLPVPAENLTLHGQVFKPHRTDYFYPVKHPKQRIVLHFTAGNLRSDMQSLTQQSRYVSVAFVIARDGTIYQLFPPEFWSGHLGEGVGNQKGTGNPQDKATIGIEISNYGFLVPRDGNLETIYSRLKDPAIGKVGPVDLYCAQTNTAAYQKLVTPFRERSFYPTYTPVQYDSLIILLRYLTAKFAIPRQFLPEPKRFQTTTDVLNFKGIVSHINYRSSGKWDIGPAFDWAIVTNGVQAAQYMPTNPQNRDVIPNELTAEETIEALFPQSRDVSDVESAGEDETTDNEGYNPADFEVQPIDEKNTEAAQNIYALLVGIDNYDNVNKLRGCVHDVKQVASYLTQRTTFNVDLPGEPAGKIKLLADKEATRQGLIDEFRKHLSQAAKDDTILFYYSGHGTQEEADPIWDETDEQLECLVCYDGGTTKTSEFLLTDKELRFLIHELYQKTGAHIVTVFDCCHSGDNTRNVALVEATREEVRERRVTRPGGGAFPARNWSEFLFASAIPQASIAGRKPAEFLPQGAHVQMAACESDQTALEVGGEGVFTKTFLKTLTDAGGNISYNTLRSRIRQYMRVGYEQTPRIYAPIEPERTLSGGVFNQPLIPQQTIAEAVYNTKAGWQLNVGAIHGVDATTAITLVDPDDTGKTVAVSIKPGGVFVDYTKLASVTDLDTKKIYKAQVSGLMAQELVVEWQNHDGNPKEMEAVMATLQVSAKGSFSFGGEKGISGQRAKQEKDNGITQKADYTVHVRAGEAYLTLPNNPYRPLIRPLAFVTADDQKKVLTTVQHVSRWHFIKNLQNKTIPDNFPEQALQIELVRVMADGSMKPIDVTDGIATLDYELVNQAWKGTIQIKITNTTHQDLYVCAAYLSKEFQCFLKFLPQLVQKLEAGKFIFLGPNGRDRVNLKLGKVEQEYNWPQTHEAIKFIVSTAEFDAEALILEELPQPLTTDDIGKKGLDTEDDDTRGLETDVTFSGWITQTLHLVFNNPVYNQIPPETLKTLLEWEETAYFAAGLYCQVKLDQFGQPTVWELKDDVDKGLKVPEAERTIVSDVKLWLGNQIESAQRRKRYNNLKKDPNRTRIVAEGDSWFQYPILVEDTLDHLYKLYAIRSFAEAGDTLENYLKKREYLDAIEEEGVDIFLVSGGGNDILGEQFESFLRDTPDPNDTTFQRYFKSSLADQLTHLEGYYEDMFGELLNRYPDLHILVHSYDYVLPIDTDNPANKGKSSWLGQYLIKKKIQPQTEREQCIHFIMDAFNDRLKAVVAKTNETFKQEGDDADHERVSYIDVRNVVNRSSWFDEIHPTNEGFQLVANRFITEIERIKTQKKKSINALIQPDAILFRSQVEQLMQLNRVSTTDELVVGPYRMNTKHVEEALADENPDLCFQLRLETDDRLVLDPQWLQRASMAADSPPMPPIPMGSPPGMPIMEAEAEAPAPSSPLRPGQMDYDIPDAMVQGKSTTCIIRLGDKDVKDMQISDTSVHAAIQVCDEMSVRLIDLDGGNFKIRSLSSERQALVKGEFTEWKINVTPVATGSFPLLLQVSCHFDGKTKDVAVLEKSIQVSTDLSLMPRTRKIAFIAAGAKTGLLLGKESNEIWEELRMAPFRDDFSYVKYFEVNNIQFNRALDYEKPTIVHFSGHGSTQGIFLSDDHGNPKLAAEQDMANLFQLLQADGSMKIECVVLNACLSHHLAEALSNCVPTVIGTNTKIGDDKAIQFSEFFYRALGNRKSYQQAFDSGRLLLGEPDKDGLDEGEELLVCLVK